MPTTPPSPEGGRDRTLYCAASCDLNHAAVPHPPWDCNAPDDVPARFSCTDANQLRQVMDEATTRLDDLIRRRDAATPGYLVGTKLFGKAAEELRGWSQATLQRQQQRPTARSEPGITASFQLTDRDREHLREEAAHRRQTIIQAVRQWPTGRGGRGGR